MLTSRHAKRVAFLKALRTEYGPIATVTRKQLDSFYKKDATHWPSWLTCDAKYRVGRGVYNLPSVAEVDSWSSDHTVQA